MVATSRDESYQRLRKTIDLTGATSGGPDVQGLLRHRGGLRLRHRRGPHRRPGRLDHAARRQRGHVRGRRRVLRHQLGHAAPVPRALPDQRQQERPTRRGGLHGHRHDRPPRWNGATGNSGGFQDWEIDLSAYDGRQVEVSISYVQDFATQGLGVFVDDAVVTKDGRPTEQTSFEDGLGGWDRPRPPEGTSRQPVGAAGLGRLHRRSGRRHGRHPLLRLRPGGRPDAARRAALMGDAMRYLGVLGGRPGGRRRSRWPAARVPPGTPADYRIRISKSKLRVDKSRRTKVRLSCGPTRASGARARVALQRGKNVLMGRRAFTTTANKNRNITVRIKKSAYRRLKQRKKIRDDDHRRHPRLRRQAAAQVADGHDGPQEAATVRNRPVAAYLSASVQIWPPPRPIC